MKPTVTGLAAAGILAAFVTAGPAEAAPVRDIGLLQANTELGGTIEVRARRQARRAHVRRHWRAPRFYGGFYGPYYGSWPTRHYEYSSPYYFPSAAYYPVLRPGPAIGYRYRTW